MQPLSTAIVRPLVPAEMPRLLDLRWRVLRAGRPFETAHMPGDDLPTTVHLGAWVGGLDGSLESPASLVGVATLMDNEGLQLRGMATEPSVRGAGYGLLILADAQRIARERGVELWCNARKTAVGFYERAGWEIAGPEFEWPDIGPHYKMRYREDMLR